MSETPMTDQPEWAAEARVSAVSEAAEIRAADAPVMDLRRLTEAVFKLNASICGLQVDLASTQANVATHEQVLGLLGAYDAVKDREER